MEAAILAAYSLCDKIKQARRVKQKMIWEPGLLVF